MYPSMAPKGPLVGRSTTSPWYMSSPYGLESTSMGRPREKCSNDHSCSRRGQPVRIDDGFVLQHASRMPRYVVASMADPQLIYSSSPSAMALAYPTRLASMESPWLFVNNTQPKSHSTYVSRCRNTWLAVGCGTIRSTYAQTNN